MQFAQIDLNWIARDNFSGDFASLSVEKDHAVRRLKTEHVAAMMRFGSLQD
jgi:hypothetical protein